MKCPKDANQVLNDKQICLEITGNREGIFCCTRRVNHKGKHHAYDCDNECQKVW